MRAPTPSESSHIVFGSESSSRKPGTYQPFANALNRALEQLAKIQVNGLPEFEAHVVFAMEEGPSGWPPPEAFEYRTRHVSVMRDIDQRLGREPDTSKPATRKIDVFLHKHSLT